MSEKNHRDHRELGRLLDLFSFHEIAPGAPFWHPKGMIIFRELERYARMINDREGYDEISTPIIVKKEVFEKVHRWGVSFAKKKGLKEEDLQKIIEQSRGKK